jgi:hypothetical protein
VTSVRHLVLTVVAGTGAVFGTATASAAAPASTTPASTGHRTVAEVQQKVDRQAQHIASHLAALRPRIAANKRLTPAQKGLLNADIAALQNASTVARQKIDADTTMDQIRADHPLLVAVHAKHIKLQSDLAAARTH